MVLSGTAFRLAYWMRCRSGVPADINHWLYPCNKCRGAEHVQTPPHAQTRLAATMSADHFGHSSSIPTPIDAERDREEQDLSTQILEKGCRRRDLLRGCTRWDPLRGYMRRGTLVGWIDVTASWLAPWLAQVDRPVNPVKEWSRHLEKRRRQPRVDPELDPGFRWRIAYWCTCRARLTD